MSHLPTEKPRARLQAKAIRAKAHNAAAGIELLRHWPAELFRGKIIAGYAPIHDEIDVMPLLAALSDAGHLLGLPITGRKATPLTFRQYESGETLFKGAYGAKIPSPHSPDIIPQVVLLPLLAFTARGERLGYGGGFYDRTLAKLRETGEVFACGVAYGAQEAASLPTGEFDIPLDGILTETGFRKF